MKCKVCKRELKHKPPKVCPKCGSVYWNGISIWLRFKWAWSAFWFQPVYRYKPQPLSDGSMADKTEQEKMQ